MADPLAFGGQPVLRRHRDARPAPRTSFPAAPGLWSQRLTTREPDQEQLEVAPGALESVRALPLEVV